MTIRRITMHQSAQRLAHAIERGNTAVMSAPAPIGVELAPLGHRTAPDSPAARLKRRAPAKRKASKRR